MKRIKILVSALALAGMSQAATVQTNGNNVTITPDGGQAKVIRLEVMNDNIIRVRAHRYSRTHSRGCCGV